MRSRGEEISRKGVSSAMSIKLRDEERFRDELEEQRILLRKQIEEKL